MPSVGTAIRRAGPADALFERARTRTNTAARTTSSRAAREELMTLTGLPPPAELQSDCLQAIVPEDRRRVAETVRGRRDQGWATVASHLDPVTARARRCAARLSRGCGMAAGAILWRKGWDSNPR